MSLCCFVLCAIKMCIIGNDYAQRIGNYHKIDLFVITLVISCHLLIRLQLLTNGVQKLCDVCTLPMMQQKFRIYLQILQEIQ